MITSLSLLLIFAFGMLMGATLIVLITVYVGKRAIDRKKLDLDSITKKVETVSSRIRKVKDLTTEQLDLQGQASGPQKNAMHGKYKNGLIGRIKEIEEEKTEILKSIITDGFDPELTVMDGSGVVTTLRLSEYLAQTGITMTSKDSKTSTKVTGKFTVHRGGKEDDDGGNNTTH